MTACASSAAAQPLCDARETFLEKLARDYGEKPVQFGVTSGGGLIELLTDQNGKTWTLIITLPDRTACFVASGENWRDRRPKPEGMAL